MRISDWSSAVWSADLRAAWEGELRHRLPAAFVDRARAIGNALAAFQHLADRGMGFPALELLERREIGVLVVERDDEAERDRAIGLVIEEAAAPSETGRGWWRERDCKYV